MIACEGETTLDDSILLSRKASRHNLIINASVNVLTRSTSAARDQLELVSTDEQGAIESVILAERGIRVYGRSAYTVLVTRAYVYIHLVRWVPDAE